MAVSAFQDYPLAADSGHPSTGDRGSVLRLTMHQRYQVIAIVLDADRV